MKKFWQWAATLVVVTFGIPSLIVFGGGFYNPLLLDHLEDSAKMGTANTVNEEDTAQMICYLAGVVPYDQHIESIKAQAVIVRTYLQKESQKNTQKNTEKEANRLPSLTIEEMKELWGTDFKAIYSLYESAVNATKGEVLTYEGQLIEPVYHKNNTGVTRDGAWLYGVDIPYLKSVKSQDVPVESEKIILKTAFSEILKTQYPNMILAPEDIAHQIQVIQKDDAGYIKQLQIGNQLIEGEDLKESVGISSTCFSLISNGDVLVFHTKGVGHGVGLSQEGANHMAKENYTYQEILHHYYTDIEISGK